MKKQSYHHGDLRSSLLASAEEELIERGVEKFSLRGVAKRAGVSHAAPAHHFGSASGLLTALSVVGFDRFSESLNKSQNETHAQEETLVLIGLAYVDFAVNNPQLFSLMFSSSYPNFSDPILNDASMKSFGYLLRITSSKPGGHDVNGSAIDIKAMAAWSTIHGISELLLSGRMRSVLALKAAKRKNAIKQILEQAIRVESN